MHLVRLLQEKVVEQPCRLMDFAVSRPVTVDQLRENGLDNFRIGVLESDRNNVGLFGHIGDQILFDERGSLIALVAFARFWHYSFEADEFRGLRGQVEAAQDFHLGINDVLPPRIGRRDLGVLGGWIGRFIVQNVAYQQLGLRFVAGRLEQQEKTASPYSRGRAEQNLPFLPKQNQDSALLRRRSIGFH